MAKNTEQRTQLNSGFAVYIGKKRVGWSHHEENAIEQGKEAIRKETTKNRFVPSVTIFDCAQILNVAFITDDANGIMVHRRNAVETV